MRTPRPTPLSLAAVLLLALAPAAAGLELPPAPVGGTSQIDCLSVCIITQPGATCDGSANQGGTFTDISTSPPFSVGGFRRGSLSGSNPCAAAAPVNLPVDLAPGQVVFFDLGFAPHVPGLHAGDLHLEGFRGSSTLVEDIPITGQATGGNATAPCVPGGTTLCLSGNRFKVQVDWETDQGTSGPGMVVPFQTTDSGLFWFFDVNNWETVVKVLNACPVNNRFWVFAGGLTNVETVITVTDTQEGRVRTYVNPLNTPFQPIQDTSAFATCP
jgi:hypothetical protein